MFSRIAELNKLIIFAEYLKLEYSNGNKTSS